MAGEKTVRNRPCPEKAYIQGCRKGKENRSKRKKKGRGGEGGRKKMKRTAIEANKGSRHKRAPFARREAW